MNTVTRFAPSPTWYLHIGSLRTLLFNYLFTKQKKGNFILRIEDTDRTRLVEGSAENLQEVLKKVWIYPDEWPQKPWDNGPYFQSERLDIYQEYIKKLLDSGDAYYCFCSPERLTELREEQQSLWLPTKYDKTCRYLTPEEIQEKLDAGEPYVIRLKVPEWRDITFHDTIRWDITVMSKDIDDQVLIKTDGFPTYHFAVVVDDHLMGVTDIIRSDEWIPSTPKHVLLYEAFWWEIPNFSHVPPLLGDAGKKLSKRTGDVSVESFLEKWYLPEAILNYIALLWWNPKTTEEYFTLDELIERFDLSQVHRAGAKFEEVRLQGFNAHYIKQMQPEELYTRLVQYLETYNPSYLEKISKFPPEYTQSILAELHTRMKTLGEFSELSSFFYQEPTSIDTDIFLNEKMNIHTLDDVKKSLNFSLNILENTPIDDTNIESIKDTFLQEISGAGLKNGQVLWPMRVALSGEKFSPWAFELLLIFGKEKSIQKIYKMLESLW